ncbi:MULTISPECIES: hypothetical protein [unclassified Agrobacterium]|uniref:hypothetical protein n=1 Tax=unclassified Agrobacterium TaxID=2632611 RepID=UPI00244B695E|nr:MULTISPECIES: hypothetical protein [unclassified Agrobacterium]MDH0614128.1 hypothetical protein [Agrobacterium sp. GD03872]MDH0695577.1 hypothetical protein [Agrobacterium sp. GD03871]MDH1058479.1 hypothetical protein [Agrobacterium sp. GD03992]MDH2209579.1 hypothetical protein [Agrobacterium sp. GD03643]MDH2218983.1 hypothetical protein [Agrobacterium sp. GD03638]
MIDKAQILEELLEAMIAEDEDITVRAVCRRSDGVFKHATDITRNEARHRMVKTAITKQEIIRTAVNRSSKKSRAELENLVAMKNAEIAQLQADKELLIASHRAMILAVAEMGGFPTWRRFFDRYQATIDQLENMRSLPDANLISLSSRRET